MARSRRISDEQDEQLGRLAGNGTKKAAARAIHLSLDEKYDKGGSEGAAAFRVALEEANRSEKLPSPYSSRSKKSPSPTLRAPTPLASGLSAEEVRKAREAADELLRDMDPDALKKALSAIHNATWVDRIPDCLPMSGEEPSQPGQPDQLDHPLPRLRVSGPDHSQHGQKPGK